MNQKKFRMICAVCFCIGLVLLTMVCAYAAPEIDLNGNEIVKNGSTWILSGIAWIVLIAGSILILKNILARNTSGIIVGALITVVGIAFVTNPSKVMELGSKVLEILGI